MQKSLLMLATGILLSTIAVGGKNTWMPYLGPALFQIHPAGQGKEITRKPILSFFTVDKYSPADTIINPGKTTAGTPDVKATISNGDEGIEFTPFSSLTNGALIEAVNRNNNKGISTSFYLADTSAWSFYTNGTPRLTINGNGSVSTSVPLLVKNALNDSISALRVNGTSRIDTAISVQANSDSASFISVNRNVKSAQLEGDDGVSPYSVIPNTWANGKNIPVLRVRHPNTITTQTGLNTSLQRDFMILPYQYGMAIEYNGVVECWVGEWSIHRGLHYSDAEGNGNGWGGVLWIGDDGDAGGVRATARDNTTQGGNLYYGELSVEKFGGGAHGDFRLRLPSNQNEFHFVYGGRGSNNVFAKISDKGFFIPKVPVISSIPAPEKGQVVFDSTNNEFKGYNGGQWVTLTDNGIRTGAAILSGNGVSLVFQIPHGLNTIPSYYTAMPTSQDAGNISYLTADAIYIYVHYKVPPVSGTNNLSFNWQIKK